jgi:hypothetical protein
MILLTVLCVSSTSNDDFMNRLDNTLHQVQEVLKDIENYQTTTTTTVVSNTLSSRTSSSSGASTTYLPREPLLRPKNEQENNEGETATMFLF